MEDIEKTQKQLAATLRSAAASFEFSGPSLSELKIHTDGCK